MQRQAFPTLYYALNNGLQENSSVPSELRNLIRQLGLYVDESGVIRCQGRIQNAHLSESAKHPVYVASRHPLWPLIVLHYHVLNLHCNTNTLVIILRQQFWVEKIRQSVKKILKWCLLCKKVQNQPLSLTGFPPLPPERVNHEVPFSCVGVDYTGNISVSENEAEDKKAYVLLSTCATSRAIALYMCKSMNAREFILVFRPFAAKHGLPKLLISDNAPNFIAASKFLREISEEPEVRKYLTDSNLEWKFTTLRAPWKGGFYERLNGVVKSCLQRALIRKRVSFIELSTIVAEAENIINNRPLTYVNEDNADDALIPAKLLYGRNITIAPPLKKLVDLPYHENVDLRENYAKLCETIRKFEKLWLHDYLSSLRERHRNVELSNICPSRIGDLVLIVNENCKRYKYPLGIIEQLHAEPDNVIRTVKIRTASGNFTRPLNQVIPLKCNVIETSSSDNKQDEEGEAESVDVGDDLESVAKDETPDAPPLQMMCDCRPMRRGAVKADEHGKQLI
ncbi:uncharacterized protein [Palaemon carinicauda]|uniref:uncharacterized protein n=1 Tax=Palaemon carinicauda TaxID=392227 RepID=UPI0035B605D6